MIEESKNGAPWKTGWLYAAVGIGILLIVGYALQPQIVSPIGGPAPNFVVPLFDGGDLALDDLQGSVVVVNFWASWCPPCREEAPVLERAWQDYKDKGVSFIGVAYKDNSAKAMAFNEEFNITYPTGEDQYGRIYRSYRVTGVPETFLIAKDGRLVKQFIGPVTDVNLEAALDELL